MLTISSSMSYPPDTYRTYLNHNFILRGNYYYCEKCSIRTFLVYKIGILRQVMWVSPDIIELTLTCEEVIIKNIIE